ncbi:hypothetical protein DFH06DRAFT_1180202 [Mycena polygramma]|nr:hypothetical protein DFH06DRAFT_1180202 [Mycena polygramma]
MGQYWMVVSLDSRQTFGHWGKLGEFIHGVPKCLELWLQATPKLPDCDSLVRPFKPGQILQKARGQQPELRYPVTAAPASNALAFTNLPADMIHEIYSHLPRFVDVVCLSSTCQALWEIGRPHIYSLIVSAAAEYGWAGERILCAGDYLENADIPEGILTEEEMAEFTNDGDNTLYDYPFSGTRDGNGFDMWDMWMACGVPKRLEKDWDGYRCLPLLGALINKSYRPPPLALPRVLRNFTRQAYVRESALLELKARYAGTRIARSIGFGSALMTRICLSSDPSASLGWDGPIHRGAWAGDRFDIVESSEWHDETWLDASDDVLKDVEDLFRAEYSTNIPKVYS